MANFGIYVKFLGCIILNFFNSQVVIFLWPFLWVSSPKSMENRNKRCRRLMLPEQFVPGQWHEKTSAQHCGWLTVAFFFERRMISFTSWNSQRTTLLNLYLSSMNSPSILGGQDPPLFRLDESSSWISAALPNKILPQNNIPTSQNIDKNQATATCWDFLLKPFPF